MKKRNAFTLVELLVVIGIIALLIGILLPALNKARQQANKASCLSNLHNMGVSMAAYVSTFKGSLPEGVDSSRQVSWWSLLAQQMGNPYQSVANLGAPNYNSVVLGVPPAPAAQFAINMANAGFDKRLGVFQCKDAVPTSPASLDDYTCHPVLMPDTDLDYPGTFPIANPTTTIRHSYRVTRIPNPTEIVLIFDGSQCLTQDLNATGTVPVQTGDASACGYNLDNNRIGTAGFNLLAYGTVDLGQPIDAGPNVDSPNDPTAANDPLRKWANIRFRHMGNTVANVLYVDGHAGSVTYKRGATVNTSDLLRRNLYVTLP